MGVSVNTYLLKGIDSDQTNYIGKTLTYLSTKIGITNAVKTISKLTIDLNPNDFLLLLIDELSVSQFNDQVNRAFFENRKFRNNQVILILDDISIQQLPEVFHYFPTYPLFSTFSGLNEDEDIIESSENNFTKFIEVLHDIAHFVKKTITPVNDVDSLVFVGPFDGNTTYEFHKITRELIHRKCNITPTIFNPSGLELISNEAYFKNVIENIEVAIHFIGFESIQNYPDTLSPAIQINNKVAKYCATEAGAHIQRIIYIPALDEETPEIIKQKVALFKSKPENLQNAELVQTPIEKFKDLVVSKLHILSAHMDSKNNFTNTVDDVYVIVQPDTNIDFKQFTKIIENKGLTYSTSQPDLDHLDLLNYHQQKLVNCKGVLIINSGNSQWLSRKLSDLKKAPGWGRKKPFDFKLILCEQKAEIENTDKSITWMNAGDEGIYDQLEKTLSN